MPAFGLTHKPSRSRLRYASAPETSSSPRLPQQQQQQQQQQPPISPAPLPTDNASSGFRMFSWKRKAGGSGSGGGSAEGVSPTRPYYPAEPPRPILKTSVSDSAAAAAADPAQRGIRFHPSAGGVWPPAAGAVKGDAHGQGGGGQPLFARAPAATSPRAVPPQLKIQVHHANMERQSQSLESMGMVSPPSASSRTKSTSPSSRRSSRPASPSATSFGQRVRTESAPSSSSSRAYARICGSPVDHGRGPISQHHQRAASAEPCSPTATIMPAHVTTPPVAYCSSMPSHGAPLESPYRPMVTQERRWSATSRTLPEQLPMTSEMAPRPPRHSSLFNTSASSSSGTPRSSRRTSRRISTASTSLTATPGVDVPSFNIIPATPQDGGEDFGEATVTAPGPSVRRRIIEELDQCEPAKMHRMTEISLAEASADGGSEEICTEALPRTDSTPEIAVTLDFSPFSPTLDLSLDDFGPSLPTFSEPESTPVCAPAPAPVPAIQAEAARAEAQAPALDPSPPFESYPSLPSLSSQTSLASLTPSSSMTSVESFPDVEEALGSMLASLSDGNMSFKDIDPEYETKPIRYGTGAGAGAGAGDEHKRASSAPPAAANPGLGLGLEIAPNSEFMIAPFAITAPLSPRKAKHKPGPINTVLAQAFTEKPNGPASEPHSAPPVINHRVAFYGTARAHPRSPSSGIFTQSLKDIALHGSDLHLDNASQERERDVPTPRMMPARVPSSSAISTGSSRDSVSTIGGGSQGTVGCRDSISAHSESSDEDLHTASIINLTPIAGNGSSGGRSFADAREEEVIIDEVGLAL